MRIDTLTIVGVGLIGGSIALAAKHRGAARRVIGVGRRQSTLDEARRLQIIEESYTELAPAVAQADLVVFCTPVQMIAAQVLEAAPHCRRGTLLTDAGSTKAAIIEAVEGRLPPGVDFVGSHPLAGSEKKGPEHADGQLFVNRLTLVTPTPATSSSATERACDFWQALGSRVHRLSPVEHDRALALTSHLPHLVASTLASTLPPDLQSLTATGFRDTTRIAAGDPTLWVGIFLQNRAALLEALAAFQRQIDLFRDALSKDNDAHLMSLLADAKKVRDALGS